MSQLNHLIREIHRRSLWQVLAIYLVGAWVVYEVILGLTDGGVLPEWFPGLAVGLFLVGLPVVLATAFVQEGAPGRSADMVGEGASSAGSGRADSPADAGPARDPAPVSRPAHILTWRNAVGLGVAAFVFAGLVGVSAMYMGGEASRSEPENRSVAVLPLENMSPDPADAYFTDGIHEEIITRLFRVQDLRTLARASVTDFGTTDRTLAEVAAALGVRYLLVGSVRRSADRSRVSVSLVEPRTGEQLWADTYEATGTDVFAVQASIAENVARALEAELTPGTRARLATLPTTSSDAYDDYLRGRDLHGRSYGQEDLEEAIRYYESAVRTDPDFALAHALLGMAHTQHYWFHYDHSDTRLQRARRRIDRALELDPDLPEAHLAMARYHYWGHLDYDDAIYELDIAAAAIPGDPEIALTQGSIHRRAGRFQRANQDYVRMTQLDPRKWEGWWNLAETYALVRRFDAALRTVDRAADAGLNPGDRWTFKAFVRLHGLGRPLLAAATLDSLAGAVATGEYSTKLVAVDAQLFLRQYDRALAAAGFTAMVENQFDVRPGSLVRGLVHRHAGNARSATAAFDTARAILEADLEQRPDDVRVMSALAIALAGLDRRNTALELAERARDLLPPAREAWRGAVRLRDLALVQTMTGHHDQAIDNLEWLLSNPSPLSVAGMKLDPTWDPLRERPDFQSLLSQ